MKINLFQQLQSATSVEEKQLPGYAELERGLSWEEFLTEYKPVIKALSEFFMSYEEQVALEINKICPNLQLDSQTSKLELLFRDCAQLSINVLDRGLHVNISGYQSIGWFYVLQNLQKLLHEKVENQLDLFKNKKLKAYHFAMAYTGHGENFSCFEELSLTSTQMQNAIIGAKLAYGFFIRQACTAAA